MAIEFIRPKDLPAATGVNPNDDLIVDNGASVGRATPREIVDAGRPVATEQQAVAGTDNDVAMTPLTTAQAIAADGAGIKSDAQAALQGAQTAQGLAEGARDSAQGYASAAGGSASAAAGSASGAASSASAALVSEGNAASSESTASQAASAAVTAQELAEDWAESPTAPGDPGTKSAKTWAGEAEDSAALADSEGNATIALQARNEAEAAETGAQMAQGLAEAARDAATVNAEVYADTAAGLSATTDGEQFQVAEGDDLVRYRNDNGAAVEVARYPSALAVENEAAARVEGDLRIEQLTSSGLSPNVVSPFLDEILTTDEWSTSSRVSLEKVNGLPVFRLSTDPEAATGLTLTFLLDEYPQLTDGFSFSALIVGLSGPGSREARMWVRQYNGSSEISAARVAFDLGNEGFSTPRRIRAENIETHPDATSIRLYFDSFNSAGTDPRTMDVREILLASGGNAAYRPVQSRLPPSREEMDKGSVTPQKVASPNLVDWMQLSNLGSNLTRGVAPDGVPVAISEPSTSGTVYHIAREGINGSTFSAGATVYLSGTSSRVLVRQFDVDGNEIRDISDGNGDYRYEFVVPVVTDPNAPVSLVPMVAKDIAPTCKTIRFLQFSDGSDGATHAGAYWVRDGSSERFSAVTPYSFTRSLTVELTTGDDAGIAGALARGASTIVLHEGVYEGDNMVMDLAGSSGVEIVAARAEENPIIRRGTPVTGFTEAPGLLGVWRAPCNQKPLLWHVSEPEGWVFVQDVPFDLISSADRHPAHRGRSHRSPHWPLWPAPAAVDLVDAPEPRWFWDAGTQQLYVSEVPGVNPETMTVRVPSGDFTSGRHRGARVGIFGITWEFAGLSFSDIGSVDLELVTHVGAPLSAFIANRTRMTDRYCTAIAPTRDGFSGSGTLRTPGRQDGYVTNEYGMTSIDPCTMWAWDDGRSTHAGAVGSVRGGLFEMCGGGGVTPAQGAEETLWGCEVRGGGFRNPSRAGIGIEVTVGDDGTGTTMEASGCVVSDRGRGFAARATAASVRLWGCRTNNCGTALHAVVNSRLEANDHRDIGSGTISEGAGEIVIRNWTPVGG